ncbi:hypothetical protein [Streptomyces sp. bgisy100]|uniref:hypothetical protein n=1 Tax=Streptomyces sp. bgisy100 TaxID=3413783 RepID=UPI003D705C55
MARRITGISRVIIAPFTVQWPSGRCLLAYAREGEMAVVATVPSPEHEHGDTSLWDVAARHLPTNVLDQNEGYTKWLMNHGWGMSVTPPTGSRGLDVNGSPWTVEVYKSHVLKSPCYSSDGAHIGRLTFEDQALMQNARALLDVPTRYDGVRLGQVA